MDPEIIQQVADDNGLFHFFTANWDYIITTVIGGVLYKFYDKFMSNRQQNQDRELTAIEKVLEDRQIQHDNLVKQISELRHDFSIVQKERVLEQEEYRKVTIELVKKDAEIKILTTKITMLEERQGILTNELQYARSEILRLSEGARENLKEVHKQNNE